MGLTRIRRWSLAVVLLVVLLVGGLVFLDREGTRHPVETSVFTAPTSFCGEYRGQSFEVQVAGVRDTSGDLRPRVAQVQSGFFRQTSALEDTPVEGRRLLVDLAEEVVSAARSASFDEALATADRIDAIAVDTCR